MNNETLKKLEFIQVSSNLLAYKVPITYVPIRHLSTRVENIRQINLFMQNKPNFPHFSAENDDFIKKQTQFKAKQTQFKANFGSILPVANPIQTQFYPRFKLTPLFCRGTKPTIFSSRFVPLFFGNLNLFQISCFEFRIYFLRIFTCKIVIEK